VGLAAGSVFGYALAQLASAYFGTARLPGVLPTAAAAAALGCAALFASLVPAARASRVDVLLALRSE
jgi:ABC-type antimicrobial peptide transport system permease subunit